MADMEWWSPVYLLLRPLRTYRTGWCNNHVWCPQETPWPTSDGAKLQCRVLCKLRFLSLQCTEEGLPSLPWSFSDALEPGGQGQMQPLRLSQHPCRQPSTEGSGAGRQIKASVPGYQWAVLEVTVYASQKVLENQSILACSIFIFSPPCVTLPALSFALLGISFHINYLVSGFAFRGAQVRVA